MREIAQATFWSGNPDKFEQSNDFLVGRFFRLVQSERFFDLVANSIDRIEGAARILENIADDCPPQSLQLPLVHLQDIAPVHQDLARDIVSGRRGNKSSDRESGQALS